MTNYRKDLGKVHQYTDLFFSLRGVAGVLADVMDHTEHAIDAALDGTHGHLRAEFYRRALTLQVNDLIL